MAEVCVLRFLLNLAISGKPTTEKHLGIFQMLNDVGRSSRAVIKHACLLKYVYDLYEVL